ncbi:MBL fold metallo-hydrolase [Desertibacillus haloalkaliphilus]|uniref:MBL fold metallo-hydrolase n=1 Tax=Desertibacillus haloalkaliphilus TaxID=1328930 RepID=UPI001C259CC7|nr:MBL fold metallo-hydrolase [Desertibacillus haloalkaliphilus]MBU8905021.1 MBL fold metallo-hydrolase [Desertibacillus haloalkaliphilus]
MKFTVIGYWHGYPGSGEATSSYLLEADGYRLLLDCGSGAMSQMQAYCAPETLDAVIVSHYHQDHIADIGVLHYNRLINSKLGKSTNPLLLYGHREDEDEFKKLSYPPYVKAVAYQADGTISIGPFQVSFCKTIHPKPCYAIRVEYNGYSLVYTADTSYFPELSAFASETDLLVAEASFYEGQEAASFGHMTSKDAATVASEAGAKQLLLTHLPHFGDHQQLVREANAYYSGYVQTATAGLTLRFTP